MAVELAIAAAGASRRELGHGEIRHILLIPLQLECFYPAGLISLVIFYALSCASGGLIHSWVHQKDKEKKESVY
jgi:hypothetical protein